MKKAKAKAKKPKKLTTVNATMEIEIDSDSDVLLVDVPLYLSALSHRTSGRNKPDGIIEDVAIATTIEKLSIKVLNVAEIKKALVAFNKD